MIISICKNQHHFVAQIDDFKKKGNEQKGIHEAKFVEAVRACGVSLTIWRDKQGNVDWTSLMGNEKKKLRNLPTHFPTFLPTNVCNKVTKLWKVIGFCFDEIIAKKTFFTGWRVCSYSVGSSCVTCTYNYASILSKWVQIDL